jgi:hypothetical protein
MKQSSGNFVTRYSQGPLARRFREDLKSDLSLPSLPRGPKTFSNFWPGIRTPRVISRRGPPADAFSRSRFSRISLSPTGQTRQSVKCAWYAAK